MKIGGITSAGSSMSVMQMTSANVKDPKIKSIQNEITDVQQKMRKVSSDEALSVDEKASEKQKLQKEKSGLAAELKRQQEELLRSQKREIRLAGLQEERNPVKEDSEETKAQAQQQTSETSPGGTDTKKQSIEENQALQPGTVITQSSDGTVILKEVMNRSEYGEDASPGSPAAAAREETTATTAATTEEDSAGTDTDPAAEFRPSAKEMEAMVSADSSMQLANRQGALVTRTDDGIAILKGEIKQDEARSVNTERKQAELEKLQKQRQREAAFQSSMLGEANGAMRSAAETNKSAQGAQTDAERTFRVSGLNVPQEEQALQQGFQVAIA